MDGCKCRYGYEGQYSTCISFEKLYDPYILPKIVQKIDSYLCIVVYEESPTKSPDMHIIVITPKNACDKITHI